MRLYLIDSSIFIFKAWFASGVEQFNREHQSNSAFIGFSDFVYRLLTEIAPQRLVFAFDQSQRHSARKETYPEYKANRSPAPDELKRQFGWCRQWIELLGIAAISSENWEADDLIGSLADCHRGPEMSIVFLTADKDLAQLVREGDLWWTFYDDKKLDYRGITKKYGVRAEQIAEQLALTGDKVDNIPGIPHVGTKTAANLLRKFGSLENLLANLSEVGKMKFRYSGRVQQSLLEHQSILETSIQLTRINCKLELVHDVSIVPASTDRAGLVEMMDEQAMDGARREKWLEYLE